MNSKSQLPPGYIIKEMPNEEFHKIWVKPAGKIFNDSCMFYDHSKVESKKDQLGFKKLREDFKAKHPYRVNLALFYKGKLVGWTWGFQDAPTTFYMCNSAVLKPHRRKNLYTFLMNEMLKHISKKGFSRIYSRHVMTNNDILIAKMKRGFKLTHFELSETYGAMVYLTYFPQKIKNEILDFRSGLVRPNKKMKKIFKL